MLCLENGLSVIAEPKPSRGSYGTTFKIPNGKRFIRCDSLGNDYTETAIMERISGKRIVAPRAKAAVQSKPNLLIDIQTKMQQINSPGFERWAKIFNLKERTKTVMYLQENGLTDLGELGKACDAAVQKFNDLADRTKAANARMKEISELQRQIGTYGKTREIYAQYRKLTGRKREKFYEQHTSEITTCQAVKQYFSSLGLKKLPSMQSLKQEYAMLQAENKKRYPEYKQVKAKMIELLPCLLLLYNTYECGLNVIRIGDILAS